MIEPGLYIVSTPIGNLKDITIRALETLKDVDLIACEDTRRAGILLKHYGIKNRIVSYHEYNKIKETPHLIKLLKEQKSIAIISDAGTPGISDPGFYLIQEALKNGIRVIPVPGPSAILSALVASGLPTDHFVFEGYLPKKPGRRVRRLEDLSAERRTIIIYESPMRVGRLVDEIFRIMGDREIVLARELTKKFETFIRGKVSTVKELINDTKPRGEFVVLIKGCNG